MSNLWTVAALLFPVAAFADLSGTVTLSANQSINLETGAAVTSGGDFLWNGSTLTPQGNVYATTTGNLGAGSFYYIHVTQLLLEEYFEGGGLFSQSAITGLTTNTIVGALDNSGNFAVLLVTAINGTSITFEFTTFGSPGSIPAIAGVQNNYSFLVPGLPNYGIAPGTLFIVTGTDLASTGTGPIQLQSTAAPGIPLTLNGASIAVTVNGVTTYPGIYYALGTQIAAVLPSGTPVGAGTITVTYNGVASRPANITVVATALGLDTYNGSGSGLGVATDLDYNLIDYNTSAKPGQSIVLWGSGLGADTADSDTTVTSAPHAVNVPLTIYIGGVQAQVLYQGSSGYPGLNQIDVTIPSSVPTGCGVSVVAVSGNIVSNTMTLPIIPGGGVCNDPIVGNNGTQLLALASIDPFTSGTLSLIQGSFNIGVQTTATALFQIAYSASGPVSLGSCSVVSTAGGATSNTVPFGYGLDAGTITISGASGAQQLTNLAIPPADGPSGDYYFQLPNSFLPSTGGSFTFTGTGGASVGSFTASISYSNPMTWTNMSGLSSITRANGQNIAWTGGAAGSYVSITGSSSAASAIASFTCNAPAGAGQFTVPPYVLLALPAGNNGTLQVQNITTPQTFTASGLNTASVYAALSFLINPSYR
jgi:uncharacterized protein (TIGR03437 family)